jgi:hypothetical protein
MASIYYHTSVKAGGDVAFARQVARGQITTNLNVSLNASLNADADLLMLIPQYVFATPVLGGQAAVALVVPSAATLSRWTRRWLPHSARSASRCRAAAPIL